MSKQYPVIGRILNCTPICLIIRLEDDNPSIHFTYDAFVCHNQDDPEDKRFVQDLIEELEDRRGLRLYVPGRDDLSGASQHINTAGEIEERWVHIKDCSPL